MTKSEITKVSRVEDRYLWDALDLILGEAREEDAAISLKRQIEESGLTIEYRVKNGLRIIKISDNTDQWLKFTTRTEPKVQEANRLTRAIALMTNEPFGSRLHELRCSLSYTDIGLYERVETFMKLALIDSPYYEKR